MYKYIKILPRKFITNLETNFCPLDMNAVPNMKSNYYRGWETNEPLVQFPKRLKEEQASLALNGVTITIDDVFDHYLRKLYASRGFSKKTVIERNDKNPLEQTFQNAIIFYGNKKKGDGQGRNINRQYTIREVRIHECKPSRQVWGGYEADHPDVHQPRNGKEGNRSCIGT